MVHFILKENAPKGTKIGFKKVENEYRFAWNHQDYWPDAMDYVTVEDQTGQKMPFECETAQKGAIPAIVELDRDFQAGEKIILRMGDQRQGGRGSYVWPNAYKLARIQIGVKLPQDDGFRKCPDATVSVTVTTCPPGKPLGSKAPKS